MPKVKNKLDSNEIALGKKLFFDKRLSKSNTVSCASCHNPKLSWQDGIEKSPGHDSLLGNRNTQSILNSVHFNTFFWDGRAKTLEEQVKGPLTNSKEMNNTIDDLLIKINHIKEYQFAFKNVYGVSKVTPINLYKAIATFEKTITHNHTKFDSFIAGDTTAMNNKEIRGMHLFRTKGRCMNCHYGSLFSDQQFHNLGLVYYKREYEDLGRYHITKKAKDMGKFRTPTLRNVMNTSPWMHNGFVWEMEGVLSMYNAGMVQLAPTKGEKKDTLFPYTSKLLKPLQLTTIEQEEIIAFLNSLSSF
ncbi:cytochrome c peroxidase [Tenacibaculum maritimum]|nr:cytochrome c peroxidase [Tenacibaculum maritimum]